MISLAKNKLIWINLSNGAAQHEVRIAKYLIENFPNTKLIFLEVGSAYGGGVEYLANLLRFRGLVYGYDTFVGHPKDLADDPTSLEATCMDIWYEYPKLGRKRLSYEYQRKALDSLDMTNAILVKGRINDHSFDDIDKVHMAMLDLDLIKSTRVAYHALKDKIVSGGFIMFHDALPPDHLPYIHDFIYNEVIKDRRWLVELEDPLAMLVILKRT
jgi:hypothetical protein